MKLLLYISLIVILVTACESLQKVPKPIDNVIASVYQKKLLLSDMNGLFPSNSTKEDSSKLISNYAVRWTQDQVFLTEAEKHIPVNLDIGDLLKRYRESLISLNFQQQFIQENLDSLVSEEELREFYEKNKDQYQLETSIIRCYLVKIPQDNKLEKSVRSWWSEPNEANFKKLARLVEKNGGIYHLEDSAWHNLNEIEEIFPKNRISARNWGNGEELSFEDNKYIYLFKVLELVSKQENAPYTYVAPKARLVLLNKRKNKLIEDFKTKLYETEMRKNNVQIFYK